MDVNTPMRQRSDRDFEKKNANDFDRCSYYVVGTDSG